MNKEKFYAGLGMIFLPILIPLFLLLILSPIYFISSLINEYGLGICIIIGCVISYLITALILIIQGAFEKDVRRLK